MAKGKATGPEARSSRLGVIMGVVLVAGVVALGVYLARRPAPPPVTAEQPSQALDALAGKVILPAIPKRPRPASLSPENFNDPNIRRSYEIARNNPELLEQMPCYCGCYSNPGHTNNLDCFVDKHGET